MLQEANVEEPTFCVMKSLHKKDSNKSISETRKSNNMKTLKVEGMTLREKENFYRLHSARSSISDMVISVSTSSFTAKFPDMRQSISNLRQDKLEKKERICFLWAGSGAVLVLVIFVMAGGTKYC
jgi:hypothetical protein